MTENEFVLKKPIYKGFVSNELVLYNTLISASLAALIASIFIFSGNNIPLGIGAFFSLFVFVFLAEKSYAPFAYKRVCIDSRGIRCAGKYLSYSEVEKISLAHGRVKYWREFLRREFYFRALESLRLPTDLYVEDMICFDCTFAGFQKKKETQGCVYIPKNKRTDAILRKYCNDYAEALALDENKLVNMRTAKKSKIVLDFIQFFSFFCLLPLGIMLCVFSANDAFNTGNVIALSCVSLFGSLCAVLNILKYYYL